jgi:hypothetical protein
LQGQNPVSIRFRGLLALRDLVEHTLDPLQDSRGHTDLGCGFKRGLPDLIHLAEMTDLSFQICHPLGQILFRFRQLVCGGLQSRSEPEKQIQRWVTGKNSVVLNHPVSDLSREARKTSGRRFQSRSIFRPALLDLTQLPKS